MGRQQLPAPPAQSLTALLRTAGSARSAPGATLAGERSRAGRAILQYRHHQAAQSAHAHQGTGQPAHDRRRFSTLPVGGTGPALGGCGCGPDLASGGGTPGTHLLEALALLEEADSYLSQGPLLQDEEGLWATGRRATVEQARFRCRLWLAEAYEHHQMPGQAATALSQLLEEDPTYEDVLARVMRLLHRQGMTHQALRSYHAFLEAADREGLEPTETIKTLATQLATSQNSAPMDAFPTSFLPMEGQNRAISPQGRQAETRVVEVSRSPLSEEQEFLLLMDEPLEHA